MKSNPLKKDPDWKERIQYVFIYKKNTKNTEDKNTNINSKNKIT